MINKKILIGAIVLGVLIIGIIGYFIFGGKKGTSEETDITDLHLESFPPGTQMGPGLQGVDTTIIKLGEVVGLSGTATTEGSVDSSIKIFDDNDNLVMEQPCVKIGGSGGFGCSVTYPQNIGVYVLKLYVEGIEKISLGFEVSEE